MKLFIFDMDGVITSSSDEHFEAWKVLAKELGFEVRDEVEELTKGVSRMDSLEVILKEGNLLDAFTMEEKLEMASKKNDLYLEMISNFTPANLLPGVRGFLEELQSKGIQIALASASKNSKMLLEKLEITEFFDYIVDPTTVPGKPEPDIFLKAANELGVDIKDCVGVEDALSGVQAIKSANMYCVGIGSAEVLTNADIVYANCGEINLEEIKL
jgi:beta-phosphoglucomutase